MVETEVREKFTGNELYKINCLLSALKGFETPPSYDEFGLKLNGKMVYFGGDENSFWVMFG